ncbi:hypothetical protein K788_0008590 [Paraburkholderia caribensis MBA4]|uniref:Uncharacterized protein n=1 Tax=Paraburkholderia caribensis MBA4 TaxID=1323664 RepID=A0A0P0REX1_9BURK|nr:hypothetical protein K788_0008590 [Paraburkholderia caribensis MBA4]
MRAEFAHGVSCCGFVLRTSVLISLADSPREMAFAGKGASVAARRGCSATEAAAQRACVA